MPWSETTKMQERMRFVLDAEGELFTMTELCERYGISRMTGHKWLRRFRQDGVGALEDRSRAPLYCPHQTDPEAVGALVEARGEHSLLGRPEADPVACQATAGAKASRRQYRRRHPQTPGSGQGPAPTSPSPASRPAHNRGGLPQPALVGRLQGSVQDSRRGLLLSPHRGR